MRRHLRTLTIFMTVFALITVTFAPVTAFASDSPLADTIPGGTSTEFAGEPYTVTAGQALAISTTTTFPDLSGVDPSIYEDGLVTLDKPFDNNVVLTLKYNGTELGTHTLTAGETSFWVSDFGGVTPRQPLRDLSENSDPFTIEAEIPESETSKTITVTIRAIAATEGNFNNEDNWVMVLASDSAAVTVTSYLDYLKSTIPTGTTTAFDKDSYSVIAGEELTIVTSTTFPDISSIDSSIYEDGKITLDKPFESDVEFTLKYGGSTIGTCTLEAGDTSIWVSELSGTTPRQRLSALSNNTDEFSVVATIPAGESSKAIEVTIEALAVYATGDDVIQVLVSDTATITVNPEQDRSFALETADVNGTAAGTATDIGTVSAQAAGTNFTLKTGTLYAISGKATNMTTEALGGTRISTITVNSAVAPGSDNFKVFIWLEKTGNWMPVTLAWEPAGTNTYSAAMNGALNYGDPLAAGEVTDGPFAFRADNASTITVQSVIKDGETVLSNELVQTITVNPLEHSVYTLSTGTVPTGLLPGHEADVNVTLAATDIKDIGYDKALVQVEVDKPGAHLYATDTEGDRFDAAEVGYWGPAGGFPISKSYSATTPFTCSFDAAGTYKVTLSLVDMAKNEEVITSKEITIDVVSLAKTIVDGSTTVLDSDTYPVVVGDKLTMSATTQFPNMSGADASIYEDGLVTLDKAFDNDVTLSLKYNGTPIGSYTLSAGDKSFWVSQFDNMTPRQKLNVFTTGAANTITIETTIPADESVKTMTVTISAVAATEGNFDNESNWTKVLASDAATVTISPITLVTGITLSGPTKMNPNTTGTITANVLPTGATNKAVTWSSSNTSIATVDNGVVTALKTGTVTITATAADSSGKKGTLTITVTTVKLVTGITISGSPEVGIGKTITLVSSVTPANAASRTVTWSSLNTSIAMVDKYGKVTGKAAGSVAIRATAADGSATYGEYAVTVKPAATKVTISGSKIIDLALADKTIQLAATVAPTDASQLVKWSSSSTSYATVDQNGKVTGVRAGTVTITAKAKDGSGRYATYTVTVSTLVNSVTIGGPSEVATGKTIQLTCSVLPMGATNKSVTWSIPAEYSAFATVSSTGLVTTKTVTADTHITVIATAKDNNKVASQPYDVTVKAIAASQADIYSGETKVTGTTQKIDMFEGVTLQLAARITPTEASQYAVWSTSNSYYATVDTTGMVTFKKAGTVSIYATARDGSGKKAYVTFKVSTLVHDITIGGPGAVAQGKMIQLTTSFNAGNCAPTNKAVTWKSSDSTIATVSASGLVTAAKFAAADPDEKTVTITATAQDGTNVNDTYDITIKKNGAASVDITYGAGESAVSVKGKTVAADLTMKDMGIAFSATVSPSDKASQGVTWSSSNTRVVTVVNGVVKVVGKGTATITVTAADGTKVKATFTITVVDKVVAPMV